VGGKQEDLLVGTEVYRSEAGEAAVSCWNGAREQARSDTEKLEALQTAKSCRE